MPKGFSPASNELVVCMKYVAVNRDTAAFQRPLTDQQLISVCQRAFGDSCKPSQWQLLMSGKFNTSYRIGFKERPDVVLRTAPPPDAVIFQHERSLLRREACVLKQLSGLSETIPENLFEDFSKELIARDYVFQPCLPGELWETSKDKLSDSETEALWQQFGSIVKKIHRVSGQHFGSPLPENGFETWSGAMISWVTGMIEDMEHWQIPCEDAIQFLHLVERNAYSLDEVTSPSLVHGDLWLKNIIIERNEMGAKITGVLDAERAFFGEPAAEWIFSFFDIPKYFWDQYGSLPADPSTKIRQTIYEGRGAVQLCLEAWRFQFDDGFARKILQQSNVALAKPHI